MNPAEHNFCRQTVSRQLRLYMTGFRKMHNLTQEETACDMGISVASYKRLENEGANNRIVSSLEYLSSFAELRNMSLPDFVSYMTLPEKAAGIERTDKDLRMRRLFTWEKDVISFFRKTPLSQRNKLIRIMTGLNEEAKATVIETFCVLCKNIATYQEFITKIYGVMKESE